MSRRQIRRGGGFTEHKLRDCVLKRNSKCTRFRLKILLVIKTRINHHSRTPGVKSGLFQSLTVVFLEKSDPNIGLQRSGRCRFGVLMAVPPAACRVSPREQ